MLRIYLPSSTNLKISSGFTYRQLRQHMNFFWGAFFPREHFFLGIICLGAFFGEHLVGSFFLGSIWIYTHNSNRPGIFLLKNGFAQICLAQKWACSNLAGSKMGLLKIGLAQIWVGSNLGWLKFGSAQIWSAQIWPLKFGLLKNGLTP